jgi:hypothetical protein
METGGGAADRGAAGGIAATPRTTSLAFAAPAHLPTVAAPAAATPAADVGAVAVSSTSAAVAEVDRFIARHRQKLLDAAATRRRRDVAATTAARAGNLGVALEPSAVGPPQPPSLPAPAGSPFVSRVTGTTLYGARRMLEGHGARAVRRVDDPSAAPLPVTDPTNGVEEVYEPTAAAPMSRSSATQADSGERSTRLPLAPWSRADGSRAATRQQRQRTRRVATSPNPPTVAVAAASVGTHAASLWPPAPADRAVVEAATPRAAVSTADLMDGRAAPWSRWAAAPQTLARGRPSNQR